MIAAYMPHKLVVLVCCCVFMKWTEDDRTRMTEWFIVMEKINEWWPDIPQCDQTDRSVTRLTMVIVTDFFYESGTDSPGLSWNKGHDYITCFFIYVSNINLYSDVSYCRSVTIWPSLSVISRHRCSDMNEWHVNTTNKTKSVETCLTVD